MNCVASEEQSKQVLEVIELEKRMELFIVSNDLSVMQRIQHVFRKKGDLMGRIKNVGKYRKIWTKERDGDCSSRKWVYGQNV